MHPQMEPLLRRVLAVAVALGSVIHPGGNPNLDDALVLGLRGVVSF